VPLADTLTAGGQVYCNFTASVSQYYFQQAANGCYSTDITDEATCAAVGGVIESAAINQATCYAGRDGCFEAEFPGYVDKKNETQCAACGGDWAPALQWREPVWAPYESHPLYWVPVKTRQYGLYELTMNYTKLGEIVSVAAVERTRLSLQSEVKCLMNPLFSLLGLVACECTHPNVTVYNGMCVGANHGVRTISIGSTLLCSETTDSIVMGSFVLEYNESTVATSEGCVTVDVSSVPLIQFKQPVKATLSSLSLSTAASHVVKDPYAIVYNKYGRQVGQVISDGAEMGFESLALQGTGTGKRGTVDYNITVNNLTVCFTRNTDVAIQSGAFPVYDVAMLNFTTRQFTPMGQVAEAQQLLGQTRWCGEITEYGTYFAVVRVTNWEQPEDLYTSVEKGFIFTIGALFLLACLVVLILIGMTIYIHGLRGFCVNLVKGKQLATLILALLFLFSILRGVWLMLAGTETINDNTSYALEAVLTDLPIYIFFSLFMLLIFFWAELYHFQFNRKQAVLGKLKIPFLLVNVFIYVFFVVIIIVYSQSGGGQSTVALVYKCIVAGIGFTILISFIIYGTLLMWQASRMGQLTKNEQFLRMTVITLICSIASLVQFIFLLLFAFAHIESVAAILIYLFIVEIIPMYLLMWVFFQPSRLQDTLSASYGSQGANNTRLRSLPKSFRSGQSRDPLHSGAGTTSSPGSRHSGSGHDHTSSLS
jgi:hypothetical protein